MPRRKALVMAACSCQSKSGSRSHSAHGKCGGGWKEVETRGDCATGVICRVPPNIVHVLYAEGSGARPSLKDSEGNWC